jgi:hypothetical protein
MTMYRLVILCTIATILAALLVEEHRHNVGVLDTVKPSQVPVPKLADDFRNYRQ